MIRKMHMSLICMIIMLCILIGCSRGTKEQEESKTYNKNEKIQEIEIIYKGRGVYTEDEVIVDLVNNEVRYTNETRVYVNVERNPNFYYTYKLDNSDDIEKYFKEKILYGNWKGECFDPPDNISVRPAGDEWGVMLWKMNIITSETKYNFFNDDQFPIYWYELIKLIADGAGTRPESFGIEIEE